MVKGIHCFTEEYPFVVKLINTWCPTIPAH